MEADAAAIEARSKKQVLDWSLVLASQEIESRIEPPNETLSWHLVVNAADHERAREVIRQYQEENRRRIWRQELPVGGLVFDWRSVLWFLLVSVFFVLSEKQPQFRTGGMMDTAAAWAGQWWRLFTAVMLHADVAHLAANFTFGALFLGLAMGTFGPGFALLGSYLAGVYGNLLLMFIYPTEHRSLGASGMVMGSLGLLAGQSVPLLRHGLSGAQFIVRGFLAGLLLLVMLGLDQKSDVVAHVGGFAGGILLGALLGWPTVTKHLQKPALNRVAEAICGALVIASWWYALRPS